MDEMIHLENVNVQKGNATLLDQISFDVPAASCTVLLGPNGSGKSTLLRAIAGAQAFRGTIEIEHLPLNDRSAKERAQLLAYAEQEPMLPPDMTLEHFVLLGRTPFLRRFAGPSAHDRQLTARALEQCRIMHLRHRALGSLSGGERRRASLAQALAQMTPVVLLDEPTTALDIGQQQAMLELVDAQRRENGTTFVIALHDLTLARQYATDIAFLRNGRLVEAGTVDSVLRLETLELHYETTLAEVSLDGIQAIVPRRGSFNRSL